MPGNPGSQLPASYQRLYDAARKYPDTDPQTLAVLRAAAGNWQHPPVELNGALQKIHQQHPEFLQEVGMSTWEKIIAYGGPAAMFAAPLIANAVVGGGATAATAPAVATAPTAATVTAASTVPTATTTAAATTTGAKVGIASKAANLLFKHGSDIAGILGKTAESRAKGKQADYDNENARAELQRKLAEDAMKRYQAEQFTMPEARLNQVGRGGAIATMRPSNMQLPSWAGGGSYKTGMNYITDRERQAAQKYADMGSANLGNEHLPPGAALPTAPATPGGHSWIDDLLGYGGTALSLYGAIKPQPKGGVVT